MFKLMGSKYFFGDMPGYTSHDTDMWEIIDTEEFKFVRVIRGQGMDYFQFRRQSKAQDYIDYAVSTKLPMTVGKFLIPEFCEAIGLTFDEFKTNKDIKNLIDQIDEKHKYEKIIYDAYLKNGSFILTEDQRQEAYKSYLETRAKSA